MGYFSERKWKKRIQTKNEVKAENRRTSFLVFCAPKQRWDSIFFADLQLLSRQLFLFSVLIVSSRLCIAATLKSTFYSSFPCVLAAAALSGLWHLDKQAIVMETTRAVQLGVTESQGISTSVIRKFTIQRVALKVCGGYQKTLSVSCCQSFLSLLKTMR